MKTCVIVGDISSDRASDQYPTVQVCDKCITEQEKFKEDSKIVSIGEYDLSYGDTCEFCEITVSEESNF